MRYKNNSLLLFDAICGPNACALTGQCVGQARRLRSRTYRTLFSHSTSNSSISKCCSTLRQHTYLRSLAERSARASAGATIGMHERVSAEDTRQHERKTARKSRRKQWSQHAATRPMHRCGTARRRRTSRSGGAAAQPLPKAAIATPCSNHRLAGKRCARSTETLSLHSFATTTDSYVCRSARAVFVQVCLLACLLACARSFDDRENWNFVRSDSGRHLIAIEIIIIIC